MNFRFKEFIITVSSFILLTVVALNFNELKKGSGEVKVDAREVKLNKSIKLHKQKIENAKRETREKVGVISTYRQFESQEQSQGLMVILEKQFNRQSYRSSIEKDSTSGGAQFAKSLAEFIDQQHESIDENHTNGEKLFLTLRTCSTDDRNIFPSFVQAYCLRRLEKMSLYNKKARKDFLIAKKEAHPSVLELHGVLSNRDE